MTHLGILELISFDYFDSNCDVEENKPIKIPKLQWLLFSPMSPLQMLQPRQSFLRMLFLFLLVSLWTESISAWIQQQHVISDHRTHSSWCRRSHYDGARLHRQEMEDGQTIPRMAGKTWNIIPESQVGVSLSQQLPSRRGFIQELALSFPKIGIVSSFFLFSSTTTPTTANAADATTTTGNTVDIDPFAAIDSIASGYGSVGPTTPTKGVTSQTPTTAAATAAEPMPNSFTDTGSLSSLDKALEESRKRKQIDPRTHG